MRFSALLLLALIVVSLLHACKKDFEGDANMQQLPETFMVVDSVKRDSNDLLITTVTAYWWGQSKTGIITGYEVSTDGQKTWTLTKEQRGTFLLNLPVGVSQSKIPVFVRAIDNLGQKDPTPATMVFPVKNSAPKTTADPNNNLPDRTFPVMSYGWTTTDIDGFNDIDHYELVFNDTTLQLFNVPGTQKSLTQNDSTVNVAIRIEGRRNGNTYLNECDVAALNKSTNLPGTLYGIRYDSTNFLYLRAVDKTGNRSRWLIDSTRVKKPVSNVLVVNALYSNAAVVQNFYLTNLAKPLIGVSSVETMSAINSSFASSELYNDVLTQSRVFDLFTRIIWLTDDPNTIATVQQTTTNFFTNNGRMFIFTQFADDFPANSSSLSITPIQSLVLPVLNNVAGRFRMEPGLLATSSRPGWPVLKYSGSIAGVRPFYTNTTSGLFTYDSLMQAQVRIQTPGSSPIWDGTSTVMSRRVKPVTATTDMIISSLPLQNMNGNNNIDSLFKKVFKDELSF